jgi:glutamine synthetase
MLVMEVLRQVADRNGLVCLLHEKPFAGVNGSGKHNNWSIAYGGTNLFDPGTDPHQNAIFLTMLCAVIEAVDKHADLIRAAVAGAGNDHRLGANEAPPAVISIYLGDQLADIVRQLEEGKPKRSKHASAMKIGVDTLPPLPKDATDRNRTSPFAFTGNKFEFRAPGSSASCAGPNIVLNTVVAEAVERIASTMEKEDVVGKNEPGKHTVRFHEVLQDILKKIIKEHKKVLFNGDGYKSDWLLEAEKRGLPNTAKTPDALKAFTKKENVEVFAKAGVFSEREMTSRYEIALEDYKTKIMIEGNCALEMVDTMIIPAIKSEYKESLEALKKAGDCGVACGTESLRDQAVLFGSGLDTLRRQRDKLEEAISQGKSCETISSMAALRATVDNLEKHVSDEKWPLPKYREMLFIY